MFRKYFFPKISLRVHILQITKDLDIQIKNIDPVKIW